MRAEGERARGRRYGQPALRGGFDSCRIQVIGVDIRNSVRLRHAANKARPDVELDTEVMNCGVQQTGGIMSWLRRRSPQAR